MANRPFAFHSRFSGIINALFKNAPLVLLLYGLFLTGCTAFAAQTFSEAREFPRIGIREGHFVEMNSGKPFIPVGANFLHLSTLPGGKVEHATFCPGVYDAAETEKMMTDLAAHGLNTVRAFHVYAVGKGGILESKTDRAISPDYLVNVVDFLKTARRHGMHVIFSWDRWLPDSDLWRAKAIPAESDYHFLPKWDPALHTNNFILSLPSVRTRSNAVLALIEGIRQADPALLRVVLAWEIENETHFDATKEPLKSRPANFTFAGKTYNLSTSAGIQNFMDDAFIQWCDFSTDAIHRADPDALASISVFTFHAVSRLGPDHVVEDTTPDPRVPARPLALLRSKLDFVDLHIYVSKRKGKGDFGANCALDLQSVEAPRLQQEAARLGKPILIGETGIPNRFAAGLPQEEGPGVSILRDHLVRLKAAGFAGALIWYYGPPTVSDANNFPSLNAFPEYQDMLRETWLK